MSDLVAEVRATLAQMADPDKAPAMQAYMKSQMPFLGIPKPTQTKALRPILRQQFTRDECLAAARTLWDGAGYREERYAALALLRTQRFTAADEPLLRHLITTGAWWDYVDEIATKLVGPVRAELDMPEWAVDENIWIRRAAIICQVGARARAATDPQLLASVIEPNTGDRRFWIAKAIGWALRDYAYIDPQWVRSFVADHDLAPLSVREATKHL